MQLTANIYIWDEFVGAAAWDESAQAASFEYDPDFISRKWDLSPVKMPLDRSRRNIFIS